MASNDLPRFVKSLPEVGDFVLSNDPQIALVGRSNVGKSSLINSLASKKDLAIVSSTPGRTRLLNQYDFGRFYLVDLPGYGFAKVSKQKRDQFQGLIYDYLTQSKGLRLVCLIIDARIGLTDLDREMFDFLRVAAIPFIVILNKVDKLSRSERIMMVDKLQSSEPAIEFFIHSAVSGDGRGQIHERFLNAIRDSK